MTERGTGAGRRGEAAEEGRRRPAELRTDVGFVSMSLLAPPGLKEDTTGISPVFSSPPRSFSPHWRKVPKVSPTVESKFIRAKRLEGRRIFLRAHLSLKFIEVNGVSNVQ